MAASAAPPPTANAQTVRGGLGGAGAAAPEPIAAQQGGIGTGEVSPGGKTPWLASLLSFFISGLGQVYNGDLKKGAVMFVAAVVGIFLTGGLATLAVWVWSMVDGWQVAAGKMRRW